MLNRPIFFKEKTRILTGAMILVFLAGVMTVLHGSISPAQGKDVPVKEEKKSAVSEADKKESGKAKRSPTDVIKTYEKEVKDVVSKYKDRKDAESIKAKNKEIIAKVRQFFNIYELSKLSLGTVSYTHLRAHET